MSGPVPEENPCKGNSQAHESRSKPRVVFVHPSPRFSGSGYYIQELAYQLKKLGCSVLVLAEGDCPDEDQGVQWHKIGFSGPFIDNETRELSRLFRPTIIFQVGVRTIPMRAALELMIQSGARLVVQAEDDEFIPYKKRHPNPDIKLLEILDKPRISILDVTRFARRVDWAHTFKVFVDPGYYRWVEPVMRILCYRFADLHCAIWHPMAERLRRRFDIPTHIVPPVVSLSDFDSTPLAPDERSTILQSHGIDPSTTVFFIAGSVYSYSREFSEFMDALHKLALDSRMPMTIAVSGRGWRAVDEIARRRLRNEVQFVNLSAPDDAQYLALLKAADIICSPGFPNSFNEYRLPSRLVKAMALAKPILTCKCGFGESLRDGFNAFLTEGDHSSTWANSMRRCLDTELCRRIGLNAREFAERHFDSCFVARSLLEAFDQILQSSPKYMTANNMKSYAYKLPLYRRLLKRLRIKK